MRRLLLLLEAIALVACRRGQEQRPTEDDRDQREQQRRGRLACACPRDQQPEQRDPARDEDAAEEQPAREHVRRGGPLALGLQHRPGTPAPTC